MRIAGGLQRRCLACRQFVRCQIAAMVKKGQRAVVGHEMLGKKIVCAGKALAEQPPQPTAADFRTCAGKPLDWPLGILDRRFVYRCFDAHPVTHRLDLAEGHPRLHHAERTGVHAEKDNAFATRAVAAQILLVRCPGIVERVIDMAHRRGKAHRRQHCRQFLGGGNQFFRASFHGATLNSNNMPGTASTKQRRKNTTQPSCCTSQPAEALMKVRGTAARLVNSANCVAV